MAFVVLQVRSALFPETIEDGVAVNELMTGSCKTVTVTDDVTVPPAPVAVTVYVVVTEGETLRAPLVATGPIPLSIDADVAFDVLQVRSALPPTVIVEGVAVNEFTTGSRGKTVTDTVAVTVPPELAAINVYVVEVVGETLCEPDVATAPMPLSMEVEVAFVVDQFNAALSPKAIVLEETVNELITGGACVTVTVTVCVTVPPRPDTVSVYVLVVAGDTVNVPESATLPIP